jgi:hypothetical protein
MNKNTLRMRMAVAAAVILALAVAIPATSAPQAKPGAAVVLEYKMPAGRSLTYQNKSEQAQVMEVQGQSMDTQVANTSTVTFKSKGPKDKNLLLGVTIDEITASVTNSMQGDLSPDMASVKGKSFDMVLSPLGAEVDVTGAEAITFSTAGESQSIASEFKTFFPDLPGKPVKVGDTWPSTTTVEEKTGAMNIQISLQNANTLDGFETIDGMECAKVSTKFTGTVAGSGNQMGMDLAISGTTKGTGSWYFAVKDGILVKSSSDSTSELTIDVSAAGMSIPMTQTVKGEIKLSGKA